MSFGVEVVITAIFSMSRVDSSVNSVPVSDAFSAMPGSITTCQYVVERRRDDHVIFEHGDGTSACMVSWLWTDTKHVETFVDGTMLRRDPKAVADVTSIGTC